jgi:hypothetical protein
VSALVDVRRGEGPDTLIAADGTVWIAHSHGIHTDEKLRVRESILRLLREVLATVAPR